MYKMEKGDTKKKTYNYFKKYKKMFISYPKLRQINF